MKLLWVYGDFLHPTTRGGQIRTLEILKRLHLRHEVHYAGLWNPRRPEGPERASEYASHVYPVRHAPPEKTSPEFFLQLGKGLVAPLPVSVFRYCSDQMRTVVARLRREHSFDCVVCDFLNSGPHFSDLSDVVLFQHNVEAVIWQRHCENAATPLHRYYFHLQARRMLAYERYVCSSVRKIISVSDQDSARMRQMYGVQQVFSTPTGTDVDHLTPQERVERNVDLVFVGSMDWLPNVDGVLWFFREIFPLVQRRIPQCTVAIVGRTPPREIMTMARKHDRIQVTGTVPDVRPWLWRSKVAIVPLRIGGGTRLKIYEAMAARTPVLSTTIGAEGLDIEPGVNIAIADGSAAFAEYCVRLITDSAYRDRLSDAAWEHVRARHSWDAAATEFERLLN